MTAGLIRGTAESRVSIRVVRGIMKACRISRSLQLLAAVALTAVLPAACGGSDPAPAQQTPPATSNPAPQAGALPPPAVPLAGPSEDRRGGRFSRRTKRISSDKFQGRGPGTVGEDITVSYLEMKFKELGLAPGNPDGTYIQKVPLVGITGSQTTPADVHQGRREARAHVEGRGRRLVETRRPVGVDRRTPT